MIDHEPHGGQQGHRAAQPIAAVTAWWHRQEDRQGAFNGLAVTESSLLPSLCWTAHERRRDLARFDGSRDRASMIFQPCFLAVEAKERMSAKSIAPCNDRKPPEIF